MEMNNFLIMLMGSIVEVLLIYMFFVVLFPQRKDTTEKLILILETISLHYLVNLLQISVLNYTLVLIILWMFVSLMFDIPFITRMMYFILVNVILLGVEYLSGAVFQLPSHSFFFTGTEILEENLWKYLFVILLTSIVFFIVLHLLPATKYDRDNNEFWIYVYICIPVTTLGIMMVLLYMVVQMDGNRNLKLITKVFFCMIMLENILIAYAFRKYIHNISENSKKEKEISYQKAQLDKMRNLAQWNDDYKKLLHNTSNYFKIISHLAQQHQDEEICNITAQFHEKLSSKYVREFSTNSLMNIILSDYLSKAEKQGVKFDIYVEPRSNLSEIRDMDLVSILGNLLDNALRAASETRLQAESEINLQDLDDKTELDSFMGIRIFTDAKGKFRVIKIQNSFSGELVEENGKLLTTKTEEGIHGVGVLSVRKIVESYGGTMEYYSEEQKFYTIVLIPVKDTAKNV